MDSKTEEKAAHADQSADNHHANGAQDHDVSTAANQAEGSEAHSADHGSEKFDAGKVIMESRYQFTWLAYCWRFGIAFASYHI